MSHSDMLTRMRLELPNDNTAHILHRRCRTYINEMLKFIESNCDAATIPKAKHIKQILNCDNVSGVTNTIQERLLLTLDLLDKLLASDKKIMEDVLQWQAIVMYKVFD